MIAALKTRMTLFVVNEKGTVSFNFAALIVSIRYELLWRPHLFVCYMYSHCTSVQLEVSGVEVSGVRVRCYQIISHDLCTWACLLSTAQCFWKFKNNTAFAAVVDRLLFIFL